jgi:uncharacterized protein
VTAAGAASENRRTSAPSPRSRTSTPRTVAIDEPLARHAGDLAAQHALRGYDAVHVACALALEGDDVLLATWDAALNAAARATGRLLANDMP